MSHTTQRDSANHRICPPVQGRSAGFTALEILITLTVLAILGTVAIPSLTQTLNSNRLATQASDLNTDILYARSEAAIRGQQVVLCISSDGSSCNTSTSNWATGRVIFVDSNKNGNFDSGETKLRYVSILSGNTTILEAGSIKTLAFTPYGMLSNSSSKTFTFCPASGTQGRQLVLPYTGRPLPVTKTTCGS